MNQKSTLTEQQQQLSDHELLLKARKEALDKMQNPEIKWLTENSRKFLESGYLTNGATPEERIMEIANRAEEILKVDGFAKKFYGYMAEGYFSLASPVWS